MSKGEKARLEIEPEWAYGKKGQPDAKIPPNAKLIFEAELVDIDWNQFSEDISNKNLALKLNVTNCHYFKGRVNWKIQGVKACLHDLNLWEMLSPGRPFKSQIFYYSCVKY